jgi:hypothetical protein
VETVCHRLIAFAGLIPNEALFYLVTLSKEMPSKIFSWNVKQNDRLIGICLGVGWLLTMTAGLWAQNGPAANSSSTQPAASADSSVSGEKKGLLCLSDRLFPVPAGAEAIPMPGGDFETGGSMPPGWASEKGRVVVAADAPQGKAYYQMETVTGMALRGPLLSAEPGRPYFISFWLKSVSRRWVSINFTSTERLRSATGNVTYLPNTDGKWKRVGIYFWMPVPARTIQFHIVSRREESQPGQYLCIDDVQLRTAGEAEMADAYVAERAQLPAYDTAPQPGDGSNLALSVAKWEGRAGIPGRPFVIWAIGSSWTEAQKDGYGLMQAIRKNFPNAPPIIYKEHDGAGTPWDFAACWVKQFVAAEQPDMIFTYTVGTPEGLDAMLTEIRRHTTADIIVPSVHFNPTSPLTPNDIENGYTSWARIREICKSHHAEFVEHRRDIADYLKRTGLKADDLLWDHVHQNLHGAIRVWDSVERHITDSKQFTYDPKTLERMISVSPPASTVTEKVGFSDNWTIVGGALRCSQPKARLTARFTGSRIDIIGRKTPGGGNVKVMIDGAPADEAPAFYSDYIRATPKVYPKKNIGGQPGDVAPQAVDLGIHLIPQSWTITMTSDDGDYQVQGSVTGPDGAGNVALPFTSKSGEIRVDPKDWRNGILKSKEGPQTQPPKFGNVTGDMFSFDVYRCAEGHVSFGRGQEAPFSQPLIQNLANREHALEIITTGDGPVEIDGLYVYSPMEK